MKKIALLFFLGVLALVPVTRAQEQGTPDGAAPVDSAATAAIGSPTTPTALDLAQARRLLLGNQLRAAQPGSRDPFSTTTRMRERVEGGAEPRFVAGSATAIPKLSLRGYAEPKGKPPVALIEVEGQGVYVVRVGDTVGLTVSGKSTVLKVQAMEASSVRIEAGSLGQVIVVR